MPAHEPPPPVPPQEHDLDQDVDVLFDAADPADATDAPQPWHHDGAAPVLPRPVAGVHLTAEQLAADLSADDEGPDAE